MNSAAPTLLIGADVAPTPSNAPLFAKGDTAGLLGEDLSRIWRAADGRVLNLESPLCDTPHPIPKHGPHLRAPTALAAGLAALEPSVVGLANNHIRDHGTSGLASTQQALAALGVRTTGAGPDARSAAEPCTIELSGRTVGLLACAETEFSGASETRAGANLLDPLTTFDQIAEVAASHDHVVVLHHGGKEGYRYPSPQLRRVCQHMVDRGADLVVCQHSHCIGAAETHGRGTIVYGQGNFIFDGSDEETWLTSLLVRANLGDSLTVDFLPLVKQGPVVRLATDEQGRDILTGFDERSRQLAADGFVEASYAAFAVDLLPHYLRTVGGFGRWLGRVDRRLLGGWLVRHRYPVDSLLAVQNYLQCEAHRELFLAGIASHLREAECSR